MGVYQELKRASRFRLHQDRKQERRPLGMVEAGRMPWDGALAHRKRRWEEHRPAKAYGQQSRMLTAEAGPHHCGSVCGD